jgi:hypothetical protein
MSVKEHRPRWATEQESKPASEMTEAEWEAHKAEVDAERAVSGQPPLDWSGLRKPAPISEKMRAYIRSMTLPDE